MQEPDTSIADALKLGGIIDNPTKWKEWQLLSNVIAAILAVLVAGVSTILSAFEIKVPFFSEEVIIAVSGCMAALWFLWNNLVAIITSRKIGTKVE